MATLAERRKHARFEVPCRVRIERPDGRDLRARTLNISDGGAFFPAAAAPAVGESVRIHLAVPRDTANTFFLEPHVVEARVVRHQPAAAEGAQTGVAVQFDQPLSLDLP